MDSWTDEFGKVLMLDDRMFFEKMLADLPELDIGSREFENVCMTVIFRQQKMIDWCLKQIEKKEKGKV